MTSMALQKMAGRPRRHMSSLYSALSLGPSLVDSRHSDRPGGSESREWNSHQAPSFYFFCVSGVCMHTCECTHLWICGDWCVSCCATLSLILLSQGFSLNLELGCLPESARDPPVSVPHQCWSYAFLCREWSFRVSPSCLHNKHPLPTVPYP